MTTFLRFIVMAVAVTVFTAASIARAQHNKTPAKTNSASTPPAEDADAPSRDILSADEWQSVDEAVEHALQWLAGQQQADGSFPTPESGQPGVTSLVVLAFLAQGEAPSRGAHGQSLAHAIDFVIRCQKTNGLLSLVGPDGLINPNSEYQWQDIPASYNHAISALMLSEAYGMRDARTDDMRHAIEISLQLSLRLQKARKREEDVGGWRYLSRYDVADSDLSMTGWYLMSLRSARNAGFDVPETAIKQAMDYVVRSFDRQQNTFTYTMPTPQRPLSRGMAGAGILALAHGGRHKSRQARAAGDWLLKHPFEAYNDLQFQKDSYHYGMFYTCQAMYQLGGDYWRQYFPAAARQLIANQRADGSWSLEANANERGYGQCYTTALAVLSLSAPNQLLPIFQR
jgi:hypothetical protein